MEGPKCTSIKIEFADGSRMESEGQEHAEAVWNWLMGAETMSVIHGAKFQGSPLKKTEPPHEATKENWQEP